MVGSSEAPREEPGEERKKPAPWTRTEVLVVAYLIVAIAVLITLRVQIDSLDFLGVGWMLVLVALPLLPWLIPRLADFLKAVSPYVQTFKFGSLQLDLRAVGTQPVSVPSSGVLAAVPNDFGALSTGTAISQLVTSLSDLRRAGGSPVGIIDIRNGKKWRLPNFYFLAWLLELQPIVSEFLFTAIRNGTDGYLLGTCMPDAARKQIERAVPQY